jgi:transmembrane sensor
MSNIIGLHKRKHASRPHIEIEARAWIIRFDGDVRPDANTLSQFRSWLDTSTLHRQVFREIALVWKDLDRWSEFLDAPMADTAVSGRKATARLRARLPLKIAAAAALGALTLLGGLFYHRLAPKILDPTAFEEYATKIGETRTVALRDGSSVQLDTGTRIAVTFENSFRIVRLRVGEAFFTVSHDAKRPFIVYAGKYAVRAVGTAFSVRTQGETKLDLTVTEGAVQVASLKAAPVDGHLDYLTAMTDATSLVPVASGQKLTLQGNEGTVQRQEPARLERDLSWRDGMLIFDNDPLEEVVARINRYSEVRIVISDDRIRALKFGGYFKVGDLPAVLATLNQNFGLKVEKVSEQLVYLSSR